MKKADSKAVLWHNVSALMKAKYGKENLTKMAADAAIGPGTAARIKEQKTSVGLDVIDTLAQLFKVEPWQLLVPQLDASRTSLTAWPFPSLDASLVRALPTEALGKIEAYIQSKVDDQTDDGRAAVNRKRA